MDRGWERRYVVAPCFVRSSLGDLWFVVREWSMGWWVHIYKTLPPFVIQKFSFPAIFSPFCLSLCFLWSCLPTFFLYIFFLFILHRVGGLVSWVIGSFCFFAVGRSILLCWSLLWMNERVCCGFLARLRVVRKERFRKKCWSEGGCMMCSNSFYGYLDWKFDGVVVARADWIHEGLLICGWCSSGVEFIVMTNPSVIFHPQSRSLHSPFLSNPTSIQQSTPSIHNSGVGIYT